MTKRIVLLAIISIVCMCLCIKIYDTNNKYGMPEEKWYGIGEELEFKGLEYMLKDVVVLDKTLYEEKFGLEGNLFDDENFKWEKKYFLMTLDIKVLEEDYIFDFSQIGNYSKYQSAYSGEYSIMLNINDKKLQSKQMTVGESVEYYMVFSFNEYHYTKEGLKALEPEDIAMVIYDYENERVNYICKGDRLDTNIK